MKTKINNQLLAEGFRHFSEISYEEYLPYQKKIECSDLTYAMLYAYDEEYPYLVKHIKSGLVIAGVDVKCEVFCVIIPLVDEELPLIYEETAALFKRLGISMRLGAMSEKYAKLLEDHPLTEKISYQEERSDYVYEIAEYLNLEGGKNAKKRRDLNRIKSEFDDIRVETVRDLREAKETILEIVDRWCEGYDCDKCVYGCERKIIERILNSDLLNELYGAVMYIGDRPEMFAIAQVIENTCYLYFKKSVGRIPGSFYYFEYAFLQPVKEVKFVNFEEDMGLPGLREYKRRRHPVKMIDKYDIQIKGISKMQGESQGEEHPESQEGQNRPEEGGSLERAAATDDAFIVKLWQETFKDPKGYIRKFLDVHRNTKADQNSVFLWKEEGICKTMLFALPAKIRQNGKVRDARYLYAIATKREERGKKYLRRILPELKKIFGEDCVLFLVPEEGVIPYYESLGFVRRQALPGFVLKREKGEEAQIRAAGEKVILDKITDVSEYCRLRNDNLEGRNYVEWGPQEISWALCDISMAQGDVYVVECDWGKFLLAGIRKSTDDGNIFQVIETTAPTEVLRGLKTELMKKLSCVAIIQEELFYMIEQGKAEGDLYLSLALNG